ncbi:GDSL esterase/lipase-like [Dorcoceras hygrometricum]|uniref:GDSL esterase/lipase-like n=1 Tax=Dorcoceras hygrometricum TaxID=472368 RepID=A0A2Z7BCX3_9LAMI|nr:GDSL esterase/lipase-like [Dorcoceras hygrometricum]
MATNMWALALSLLLFSTIYWKKIHVSAMELRVSKRPSVAAMYLLGDSSVDCGENTPFYSVLHQNLSMYPCNGSDSSLVPQILASKMGLQSSTPFYGQNGTIYGLLGGVNFGSAQATILSPRSRSYQSLNQQLRQAFETIQLLQLHLGEERAKHFVKSSLFYLSFGKDDFIRYFVDTSSGFSIKYNGTEFSRILARQMTNAVRNLYASNVRKIVCSGVLPLGCAPHMLLKRDDSNSSSGEVKGCFDEVNLMILEYNRKLEENIAAINVELPDAHIVFCDVFRAMMEFIDNPRPYGIEDVDSACCGLGKYGGTSGCISTDMACQRSLAHVWWDLYNPTTAVNSLIADSAWSGHPLSAISRPITVQELVSSSEKP